ncbi:MAG TPA: MFS transporter [Opitutaceae bacterium]|jgi:GPH family glycoside/pentoside/hexuronide:cation symporter|nr:MFS transporter [Opitutaceae bacterium]
MTTRTAGSATPEPSASTKTLRWPERASYGLGDFASCLYWATFMKYLYIYYTDVFGLSAAAVATMMLASRSSDAFFDPVMGMLADRTKTRWGKFRPYFLWMCVPMAIAGVLTFTTPHLGPTGKLIWAIVTFNGLMLIYTAINIPYTALLGVITTNPLDRTVLSSIKYIGAFAGGIFITVFLMNMVKPGGLLGASSEQSGYQMSFMIIGALACLSFGIMFFMTRERVEPPKAQKTNFKQDLKDLVTNGPWLILVGATLAFILYVALPGTISAYYFKYYVGDQVLTLPSFLPKIGGTQSWSEASLISAFNTVNQGASLAGVVILPWLVRAAGRKAAYVILMAISIPCILLFALLRADQVGAMLVLELIWSIATGPMIALLMTQYADSADYGQWRGGRRATGLIFSACIFSQKIGWAIGGSLGVEILALVGYRENQHQTPGTLHMMVMLMSLIPIVFGVISMVFVMIYPLNERRMTEIHEELKARGLADGSEGAAASAAS